jgi:transposase InsO family protein
MTFYHEAHEYFSEACGMSNYWKQKAVEAGHNCELISAKLVSTLGKIKRKYESRSQAIGDIAAYIEPFYNQKRRHAKLGNISPVQYELRNVKVPYEVYKVTRLLHF